MDSEIKQMRQQKLTTVMLKALAATLAGFDNREILKDGLSLPLRKRTPANDAFNVAFVGLTLDSGIRQPIGRVAARAVKRNGGELPISGVLSSERESTIAIFPPQRVSPSPR